MKVKMNFNQMESTPAIKEMIESKSQKISKFFDGNLEVEWTCHVDKAGHHSHVEVWGKGFTLNANSTQDDLYKTFDDAMHKIERQLTRKKDEMKDKIHRHTGRPDFEQENNNEDYED